MQSENKYLGDDKFKKFLEHYACPTSLGVVKMRFVGAICSPYLKLRPTDVISSLWSEGRAPRLETKEEADLFFKFFMGLWDECFSSVKANQVTLPAYQKPKDKESFSALCRGRYDEIEYGFLEGFWAGQEDFKLQSYIAELLDSLSQMAEVYVTLEQKAATKDNFDEYLKHFIATDKMVEKSIAFLIENTVLPRIEGLQRTIQ